MGKLKTLLASKALLADGWADNVRLVIGSDGIIQKIIKNATFDNPNDEEVDVVVPGPCNEHTHTFQGEIAGKTQHKDSFTEINNFWTWRTPMYASANDLTPENVPGIYGPKYRAMLEGGYTSACEFHYVHHDKDGTPYENPTIISEKIIETAKETGLPITHLLTFYAHSGFDGAAPLDEQKRFSTNPKQFLAMFKALQEKYKDDPNVKIGIALHSLRAAMPEEIKEILESDVVKNGDFPIHMHIAEQTKEVEDCIKARGKPPVQWWLDEIVDKGIVDPKRMVYVHATHMTEEETKRLAKSGGVVVFCPTTEGDLGDGVPNAELYIREGGKWGVGSDSNVRINAFEELNTLATDQNKKLQQRNTLAIHPHLSVGRALIEGSVGSGKQASGQKIGVLCKDARADLLVLNPAALQGREGDSILDTALLTRAGQTNPIQHVMTAGQWRVRDGKYHDPLEAFRGLYQTLDTELQYSSPAAPQQQHQLQYIYAMLLAYGLAGSQYQHPTPAATILGTDTELGWTSKHPSKFPSLGFAGQFPSKGDTPYSTDLIANRQLYQSLPYRT